MNNCVFCKIVKGEITSKKILENENVIVIVNINPVAEIHLLAIPKVHIDTFLDLGNEINYLTGAVREVIKSQNLSKGYKLVINGGKYQSIPHFHLHLLAGKLEGEDDILNQT